MRYVGLLNIEMNWEHITLQSTMLMLKLFRGGFFAQAITCQMIHSFKSKGAFSHCTYLAASQSDRTLHPLSSPLRKWCMTCHMKCDTAPAPAPLSLSSSSSSNVQRSIACLSDKSASALRLPASFVSLPLPPSYTELTKISRVTWPARDARALVCMFSSRVICTL